MVKVRKHEYSGTYKDRCCPDRMEMQFGGNTDGKKDEVSFDFKRWTAGADNGGTPGVF